MYYKEKEIDGILCFRLSPKGEFRPCGVEQLTTKVNYLRQELSELSGKFKDLQSDYNDLLDRQ